ncbi:MAG: glycosyltransferase family 4 protein [Rothia sp. (in: high G+C Gram-positive bacteria)]|nr:glycosyltransferase family 4 protein [Rothia sp. (in: high G+C Gram-positive bacteria)]
MEVTLNGMKIYLATNNGDIGGGEVMLFNIAQELKSFGHHVVIVGPSNPCAVTKRAASEGLEVLCLPATNRRQYLLQLRKWNKSRKDGLLWCNGLVPSFATSGHFQRVVHFHQVPVGKLRWLQKPVQYRASASLIPSKFGMEKVPGTIEFYNWVQGVNPSLVSKNLESKVRVGFIGRPSQIKGTDFLANAIYQLNTDESNGMTYELVVAGEPNFIGKAEQQKVSASLKRLGNRYVKLGKVEPENFYQEVDMVVVPSQCEEVFGLVAAEAMSAKKPLIVSNAGALPELVGPDYPWIFDKEDILSLKLLIAQVAQDLSTNPMKVDSIVEDSYWRWYEFFSPEAGKKRLQKFISIFL